MPTQSKLKIDFAIIESCVFNFVMLSGILTLTLGLASCGGGSGENGTSSNAPSIAYITGIPAASGVTGIIAAPAVQPLTIYGANFVSGTSVAVTNGSANYTVTSTDVPSSTKITTNVMIASVPTDSYVTVTLQPPSGNSVNGILGVAHAYKTLASDIQPILTNNCAPCHSGGTSAAGGLDMSSISLSASYLYNISIGCPQNLRVTAGDPRRASNVLLDLINTTSNVLTCNASRPTGYSHMPPAGSPALNPADIEAIVDWIALGAN
jgi:hypothetical protein